MRAGPGMNGLQAGLGVVWGGLLGVVLGLLVLVLGCAVWPRLSARFDRRVLVVPEPGEAPQNLASTPSSASVTSTERWCTHGLGHGACPWWAPWRLPQVDLPLAVATLPPSPGNQVPTWVQGLADRLDGSVVLAGLHTTRHRLWYRLWVKWCDIRWWRQRQPTDPWDCGHLHPEATLPDLKAFRPRRATLVVVHGLPPQALLDLVRTFQTESPTYRQPVRLLLTGEQAHATLAQAGVPHQVLG